MAVDTTAVVVDLAVIVVCGVGLWVGARFLVDGAVTLAGRVGLSETVVGLTVVAVGTSAPELAVTVDAAAKGRPDIAVGNVVGSNVFNLGLVLGALAVFGTIPSPREVVRRDGPVLVGAALLVTAVVWNGTLSRVEGAVLVAAWLAYLGVLLWRRAPPAEGEPTGTDTADGPSVPRTVVTTLLGLALVVGGADLLVGAAADLGRAAGLAEWFIGLTIVAAGTSLPEVATAARAAGRGRHGVSAGTLLGSDLSNFLLALGLAAVVEPLVVGVAVAPTFGLLVAAVLLAVGLLLTGRRLTRAEGALLVLLGLVRLALPVVG